MKQKTLEIIPSARSGLLWALAFFILSFLPICAQESQKTGEEGANTPADQKALSATTEARQVQRVMVLLQENLNRDGSEGAWNYALKKTLSKRLRSQETLRLEIYDISQNPEEFEEESQKILGILHNQKYDLVVGVLDVPGDLLTRIHKELPKDLPLLFVGYKDLTAEVKSSPVVSGIELEESASKTVDLGLALMPKAQEIAFVSDRPQEAEELAQKVGEGTQYPNCTFNLIDATQLKTADIFGKLKALPATSFIVLGQWSRARERGQLARSEIIEQINENCKQMCLVSGCTPFYYHSLGGYGVSGVELGEKSADLAEKILGGKGILQTPFELVKTHPVVNMTLLLKRGLDEGALPSDVESIAEPIPFWNPSKKTIIFALVVTSLALICLAGMIVVYLRHRRYTLQTMAVFEALPVRVCVIDIENNILFCQFEEGFCSKKAMPRVISDLKHLDPKQVNNTVRWVLKTGESASFNYKEGEKSRMAVYSPLKKDVYGTKAVIWVSQDVTEIKEERSRAEKLAEQHRITLESMEDGLVVTDAQGNITLINEVAAQMCGSKRREARGQSLDRILNLIHTKTSQPLHSPYERVMQLGSSFTESENVTLLSKSGTRYRVVESASSLRDAESKITGVVVVIRDVTREYEQRDKITLTLQTLKNATKLANISCFSYNMQTHERIDEMSEICNWTYEKGKPVDPQQWIVPEDYVKFKEGWEKLLRGEIQELNISYRSTYTDKVRYYTMLASYYKEEGESVGKIFGVIQDVTFIGENERKYNDTNALFGTLIDRLPCYVYARDIDDEFRYVLVNQHVRQFFQEFNVDVQGKTLFELDEVSLKNELLHVDLETVLDGKPTERTGYVKDQAGNERILKITETRIRKSSGQRLLLGVAMDVTEIQQIQDRENESRELLQLILNHLPACVLAKDADDEFKYVIWNKELERHTGVPAQNVIGRNDFEIDAYPGFAEDFRSMDEEVLQSGHSMRFVVDCVTSRGEKITYNTFKTPLKNHKGKRLLIELRLDVTREKKLERDRIEMIKTLNDLVENGNIVNECLKQIMVESDFQKVINQMLSIVGSNGNADHCYIYTYRDGEQKVADCVFEWMREGIQYSLKKDQGIKMEDLPGWNSLLNQKKDVIVLDTQNPPEELKDSMRLVLEQDIKSLIVTGLWVDDKLWGFIGLDFVTRTVELSENNVRTVHNAANLYQLAQERNRQMNALAESSFRQKQIFDNIVIPIALYDTKCNVVIANPSYFSVMENEDKKANCQEYLQKICESGRSDGSYLNREEIEAQGAYQLDLVQRGHREFIVNMQPIFDRQNRLDFVLETAVDVTEINDGKRRLEEAMKAAQAADRAKSYFLATMSHELRTPLNAVIGFSELLQTGKITPEQQKDYLQSIHFAGNALLSLINDVLDLSKIEAEHVKIVPQKTNFVELIDEICGIFQKEALRKGLKLGVDCPRELPLLYLDKQRVRQILFNLTGNAVKFTHEGEINVDVVFIKAAGDKGTLRVSVRDTGIGIKKDYLEKIFDPFVQQESVRGERSYQGSGLGLAISRRLVEKMDGQLTLESQEGKGSTFTVCLNHVRFADKDVIDIDPEPLNLEDAPLPLMKDYKVLLVDDVKMNVKVLSSVLSKMGIEPRTASSGAAALEVLETFVPNLVLTDIWMPKMNGSDLAKKIRERAEWATVKVVAVTADTDTNESFNMDYFDDILLKPLTMQKIETLLKKLYSGKSKN